jgi:hypothetical protein
MISAQSTSDRNERCRYGVKQSRTSVNFATAASCTTVLSTLLVPSLADRINGRPNVETAKTTGFEK